MLIVPLQSFKWIAGKKSMFKKIDLKNQRYPQWRQYRSFIPRNTKWPLYISKTVLIQWEVLRNMHFLKWYSSAKTWDISVVVPSVLRVIFRVFFSRDFVSSSNSTRVTVILHQSFKVIVTVNMNQSSIFLLEIAASVARPS